MKSNTTKCIGKIALGVIFLLNPNITVIDILPDFIGCLLIISGLASLRDLSDSFEEARRNFIRLLWVSLSHIPAFVLMIFISASFVNEKTSILVFAFVYAVVELFLVNNALTMLIDGFVYVGERYNGDSCFYETKKNGRRLDVSHLRAFTTLCLVLTKGLGVLPNLVYLYDTSLGYGAVVNQYAVNPVSFIGPVTAICFIPGVIICAVWSCRMYSYISKIKRDENFVLALDGVIESRSAENTAVYRYRRTSTAVYLITAAIILCADFYVDEFNILPDIFSALVMIAASLYMRRKFNIPLLGCAVCGIYAALEAGMLAYASYFNVHFKFSDVGRVVEADAAFNLYIVLLSACALFFVLSLSTLLFGYTRVLAGGFESAVRQGHTKGGKDIFYEAHKKRNLVAVVLSVAACVCQLVQIFSMGDMKRILLNKNSYTDSSGIYVPSLEGFWMVSLIANIVLISFVIYTVSKSREELKERLYIL